MTNVEKEEWMNSNPTIILVIEANLLRLQNIKLLIRKPRKLAMKFKLPKRIYDMPDDENSKDLE